MPGWMDLAYTTAGGVVGAAVTHHLSRTQERRELRAAVMQQLLRVTAVRDEVYGIAPSRREVPARQPAGVRAPVAARFGAVAVLEDGRDAERAQREAVAELVAAALSAGVPRRVLDFAGGGAEHALRCEVLRAVDARLGGVLGAPLDELTVACEEYRQATAQLLLGALWQPWRTRPLLRVRLRALRRDAAALHRMQVAVVAVLTGPQHLDALAERLRAGPPGQGPPRTGDGPGPAA
ncbi:hypothetical protein [Streptomyces sp. WAC07061]|uniref:hypothetical protein n=1 Tax=Streptomyces sp. WAC07061 TaxID=2487410 RepID=UPI00163D106B|nr:hypothetical protein [Streptomyces sp. WAC07061]